MRILLAVDGSPGSAAAVHSVAERQWPAGAVVRVFSSVEDMPLILAEPAIDIVAASEEVREIRCDEADAATSQAAEILTIAGLPTEVAIGRGNPSAAIIEESTRWDADWIVLGANETGRVERWLRGSVIASVVQDAPCSVEVIRKKQRDAEARDFDLEAEVPLVDSAVAAVVQRPLVPA